jgi:hypothetical protein
MTPAALSPLRIFAPFPPTQRTDKSPIVDPRGAEIGTTNDRLVAAKLVRVFRLQSPKSGLSPACWLTTAVVVVLTGQMSQIFQPKRSAPLR